MTNKVLVTVFVARLGENFEVFIPISKSIGNITYLIAKAVSEMTNGIFPLNQATVLYNKNTGESYNSELLTKNTDIRNGTELILL